MIYAKTYKRVIAVIIDYILFFLIFTPITYLVKGVWIMSSTDHLWIITDPICIIFLIFIGFYYVVFEKKFGQTLGKRIMRIKIISETENRKLNLKQVILRLISVVLDGFLLGTVGIISIHISASKQRIGDKLAKTVVVDLG